eukprot:gene7806-biopygen21081
MPAPPKRKKPIARATRHARATPTPVSWDPRGGDQHTFWCQGALRKNVSSAPHPIASKRDPGRALSRAEGTPHDVEPYGLHADGDGERSVQPCEGAGLARQRALSAVFLAAPPHHHHSLPRLFRGAGGVAASRKSGCPYRILLFLVRLRGVLTVLLFCRTRQTRRLGPGVPSQARPPGGGGKGRGHRTDAQETGLSPNRPLIQGCPYRVLLFPGRGRGVLTEYYFLQARFREAVPPPPVDSMFLLPSAHVDVVSSPLLTFRTTTRRRTVVQKLFG